jgi:uncharacterized protein (DUF305 family)
LVSAAPSADYPATDRNKEKPMERSHESGNRHYALFALNMVLSLIVMYLAMYSMIDGWVDFRNNVNMFYMALAMAAPMGAIMLLTMGAMYRNRRLNLSIYLGLAAIFVAALVAIRAQAGIGDRQFIASMIPHHSGAILMCGEAEISDPKLAALCDSIEQGQRQEIEQMNAIASRLGF